MLHGIEKEEKMSRKSQLLKTATIYAIGNFATKILNFIFVPIYTFYVTTADMGVFDVYNSVIWMIQPLVVMQIQDGMFRWILGGEKNKQRILATGYRYIFFGLLAMNCTYLLLIQFVGIEYPLLVGLLVNAICINPVLLQLTRAEQNTHIYIISSIITTIVTIISNVICVCYLRMGTKGLLLSSLIAIVVSNVYMLVKQPQLLQINLMDVLSKKERNELLLYSLMLIPNSFSFWILNSSDKLLIKHYLGEDANGIYAIATKFPSLIQIIGNVIIQAFTEQAIMNKDADDRKVYYSGLFNQLSTLLLTMTLIFIPITKYVVLWFMADSYSQAYRYSGFLYIAIAFFVFAGFYGTEYISNKRSESAMITTIVAAIINVVFNVIFMKKIGLYAASLSTLVAYIVLFVIRIIQLRETFLLNVEYRKLIGLTTLSIVYCIAVDNGSMETDLVFLIIGMFFAIYLNYDLILGLVKRLNPKKIR